MLKKIKNKFLINRAIRKLEEELAVKAAECYNNFVNGFYKGKTLRMYKLIEKDFKDEIYVKGLERYAELIRRYNLLSILDANGVSRDSVYTVEYVQDDVVRLKTESRGVIIYYLIDTESLKKVHMDIKEDKLLYDEKTGEIIGRKYRLYYHLPRYGKDLYTLVVADSNANITRRLHECKRGYDIHHLNGNAFDIRARNLVYVTKEEHGYLHSNFGKHFGDFMVSLDWDNKKMMDFYKALSMYYKKDCVENYFNLKGVKAC